jgi:hypothetical protein
VLLDSLINEAYPHRSVIGATAGEKTEMTARVPSESLFVYPNHYFQTIGIQTVISLCPRLHHAK